MPKDRTPVREGAQIINAQQEPIGQITSGGFGPSFGGPLAMGYVENAYAALGTEVFALVRGKSVAMEVVETPFVAQRYYRG
ncbi:Aminomethyltransferase [compost metagenome]